MGKLTCNSIRRVIRYTFDGMTYGWFVSAKKPQVSMSRGYFNHEDGKTVIREYPQECLPKCVQKFISTHEETLYSDKYYNYETGEGFRKYAIE